MILEIIDVLRQGVVAVIQSAINTTSIFFGSIYQAFLIFRAGVATASPIEVFIVLSVFCFIGYMAFRFFLGSASQFGKYILILIMFFLLTVMLM